MKRKTSQTGSAHVVIIICLVLALLTALGWIFYQNFIAKTATSNKTDLVIVKPVANPNTSQPSTQPAASTQYLKIPELGIKLPLTSEISDLTYAKTTYSNIVELSSQSKLGALYHQIDPSGCATGQYFTEPNLLGSGTFGMGSGAAKASVTIGGTLYYLTAKGGHAFCYNVTPTADQQSQIDTYSSAVYKAVDSAVSI